MKKNLALLVVALIVGYAITELIARAWVGHPSAEYAAIKAPAGQFEPYETPGEFAGKYDRFAMMTYNPNLSYIPVPRWHGNGYATNAQGLRDDRDLEQLHQDLILVTGGSTAWGAGVSQQQLYTRFAEKAFNERNAQRAAVVSAGVGAYVSSQELTLVLNRLVKFKPKLVVMLSGWNDTLLGYYGHSLDDGNDYLNFKEAIRSSLPNNCNPKESKVCIPETESPTSCDDAGKLGMVAKSACQLAEAAKINSRMKPAEDVVAGFIRNVTVMTDLGKREGFGVIVALQPTLYATNKRLTEYEQQKKAGYERTYVGFPAYNKKIYGMYRDRLPLEANRTGFLFVDMDGSIEQEKLTVFDDHVHFGDRGNRLMGEYLASKIEHWAQSGSLK